MSEIDRVLKAVFMIDDFRNGIDDDFIDRLNRQYAPTVLVVFTILLSIKQIVGDPINCWCPAQFVKAHVVRPFYFNKNVHDNDNDNVNSGLKSLV